MTTIIRVKRHIDTDPVDALVLACKRRKVQSEENVEENVETVSEPVKTILKFSGTVDEKDNVTAAQTVEKTNEKANFKNHIPNITSKNRTYRQGQSEKNRFKVISCLRAAASDLYPNDAEQLDKKVTIVDVEQNEGSSSPVECNYVYDLYSTNYEDTDIDDGCYDRLVSVHPVASDFEFRSCEDDHDDHVDPDEDDSNDECNWRNDYPDSDHSINEDDMQLAAKMNDMYLDLSSDSDEERYLNMDDDDDAYARYKRRVLKEMEEPEDLEDNTDDEGEDFY